MIESLSEFTTTCAGCASKLDLTEPHIALDLRIERLEHGARTVLGVVEVLAEWCSPKCFAAKRADLLALSEGPLSCATCAEPVDPTRTHVSLDQTLSCYWDDIGIPLSEALAIATWCSERCFAVGRQRLVDALK
jgi:hypothetical protein